MLLEQALMPSSLDTSQGPQSRLLDQAPEGDGGRFHVAIIMDGNGRWAKSRNQIRTMGHHAGVNALRRTIKSAPALGITHLTVYAFSTENWRRPADEVSDLMGLLRAFIRADLERMHKEGVRVRVIGQVEGLPKDIIQLVRDAEKRTENNKVLGLQVALNYGAQADILEAARAFAQKVAAGEATPQDLTPESFAEGMTTKGLPPLDLLIRTSGEHRLSNFLLWEAAYAEFVFQDILWPDYDVKALEAALEIYRSRDRRFGGIGVPAAGRV
jgi:undecaprenyl diphosphate synthase